LEGFWRSSLHVGKKSTGLSNRGAQEIRRGSAQGAKPGETEADAKERGCASTKISQRKRPKHKERLEDGKIRVNAKQ